MALWNDEKYRAYINGPKWGRLRSAVKRRAKGVCERCHCNPIDSVHHLTYIRLYKERLTDLQGLCFPCHQFIHGHLDEDPAYDSQRLEMCDKCGLEADLVGHTGRPDYLHFCEPCSTKMQGGAA